MNSEKLKEYIKIAKEAVKDENDEQFKIEGYKIILEKLLNSSTEVKPTQSSKKEYSDKEMETLHTDIKKGKDELAKNCGISLDELEDVISISKSNEIEIIVPVSGNDAKKHIVVGLCVLAASEFILEREWIESPKIAECLRAVGVKDLANLSATLKKYSSLIRTKGSRGVYKKYRLTSNEGRAKAFEIVRKLAKGEEVDVQFRRIN